jgi:hypothetical protein
MFGQSRWVPKILAVGFLASLSVMVWAADDPKKEEKPKADPPGTSAIMAQLRARFAAWDKDKDGYLDKWELAQAFRNSKVAFDGTTKPKDDDKDKPKDADKDKPKDTEKDKDADKDKPKETDKDKPTGTEKDKDAEKGKDSSQSKTKPDYSKYPDYQFLTQLDKDGDDRISKAEFEDWARDYAVQLKTQTDAQNRIAQAEARLNGKLSQKERQQLERDLKHERDALNKVNNQMKNFEKYVQNQLKR